MDLISLLVPIALFAMIFGIVYIAITASNRQKIAISLLGVFFVYTVLGKIVIFKK